ncbi:SusC/RagA family TonB-linked outer membrane protein [Pedobacter nyackensis]|nr:SusC/RagA family TonB-linked outer membrane protein [Pedobacter nyackensis]
MSLSLILMATSNLQASAEAKTGKIILREKNTRTVAPIRVSGKVVDQKGAPMVGVSITTKGVSGGTVSDVNGNYTINVPSENAVLIFQFLSYVKQEITVGKAENDKKVINVTLNEDTNDLNEVVVVGYGTQKKHAVTGAVVTADLKTYDKVPVNNILEVLKGTVAGLNVGEANTAGGVPGVTIRGTNTSAAGNSPLIILDGTIFEGSMADISPSDIESATILKDASAAAIYGARSANGVILIESKKGGSINGKPKFEFQSSYGTISELQPLKVYDAPGYMRHVYDVIRDNGTNITFEQAPNYLQVGEKKNYDATPDHAPTLVDPYSVFSQTGRNVNTGLSISQRTDKMSYFVSGNMTDQQGVIINDAFKHYSVRLNLESNVTNWLTLGVRSYYSHRNYPDARIYGVGSGSSSPYLFSPYANLYNADGTYNMYPQTTTSFINPFLVRATEAENKTNNLNAIFNGTIKVPWVKGLTYTATYSKTLNGNENGSFYGLDTYEGLAPKGKGSRNYSTANSTLLDHLIKYNHTFGGIHNVDLTLLHSDQKKTFSGMGVSASGFDNDQLGMNRLQAGSIQNVSTSASESTNIGQMARLTYSYNSKYSVTGTVRHDGFSAFSANHKYGDFVSVGMNWNIIEEKFMKSIPVINALALRASYGTNGNQSIASYSTLSKISNGYYYYQGDGSYTYTQGVSTIGNDDLVWESTTGLNAGIDFAILNSRLAGSIDGYMTRTNNLAFNLNLPGASGFSGILANAGELRNKGLELNLRSLNVTGRKFSWRTEAAFSLNRNKWQHLLGDRDGDGKEDDIVGSNQFIGKPLSVVYGYKVTGMWQQEDKDNGTIMAGFLPGHYKLEDVNGDGKITSDADRVFMGNTNANFRWSLTNTFSYGNLSMMVYLNSIWGGNGYFINGGNTPWDDAYANRADMNHPIYDYWTPENPGAEFPRPSYKDKAIAKAPKYYDRSFIRLQKVAVSYDASKHVKKYGVNGLNIALSADNLATYAPHWIGLDAATGNGLTVSSIPSLRTVSMNINVNF